MSILSEHYGLPKEGQQENTEERWYSAAEQRYINETCTTAKRLHFLYPNRDKATTITGYSPAKDGLAKNLIELK